MRFLRNSFTTALILFISFSTLLAQDTTQIVIPGRQNSLEQQKKPYVILISADGFRYDLADKYDAQFLKQQRSNGVWAQSMQPSFPSLTFPNHYSIVTGLYPAHHGIVSNTFYADGGKLRYRLGDNKAVTNGAWYGGVPLWVLAEQQKMLSASFYWVGSEAPIDKTFPTYYFRYNEKIPMERRVAIVKEWLQLPESQRPHFITFYMPEVDHEEHANGVTSEKVRDAVQFVDHAVKRLTEMTDSLGLPVSFIFVSDHGMMDVDTEHPIYLPKILDTSKFVIGFTGIITNVYAKNKKDIKPVYRQLKKEAVGYSVYLKKNTPKRWHYGKRDDCLHRLGDIILVADPGRSFGFPGRKPAAGAHGYDNAIPEMQATFYAWGPAFKSNQKTGSFANVNIYPLIAKMLGLSMTCKVDGKIKVLEGILK